jgi:hypothetical protein
MWYIDNVGANGSLTIGRSGLDVLTFSNGGNLGLGVTPSAWNSPFKAMQIGSTTALWDISSVTGLSNNLYNDGTSRYLTSDFATIFQQWDGGFAWLQAPSGTAGNAISFTQAMTLTAAGNLVVGGTTAGTSLNTSLTVNNSSAGNYSGLIPMTANVQRGYYGGTSTGLEIGVAGSGYFSAWTSGTERLRITSGGFTKASNNGTYAGATDSYHELRSNVGDDWVSVISNSSASPYGIRMSYPSSAPNNTANFFLVCADSSADRLRIMSNGNIVNTNNSYGAISDVKLKENISDATPKLDDLLKVKIRNYNLIGDETKQLGVVAQELEEIFPSMIEETKDFKEIEVTDEEGNITTKRQSSNTFTKSVKYSVFVPMLIKAIQELEARVKELEAK